MTGRTIKHDWRCIRCGGELRVTDSRPTIALGQRNTIRRRRACDGCGSKFTSYELSAEDAKAIMTERKNFTELRRAMQLVWHIVEAGAAQEGKGHG